MTKQRNPRVPFLFNHLRANLLHEQVIGDRVIRLSRLGAVIVRQTNGLSGAGIRYSTRQIKDGELLDQETLCSAISDDDQWQTISAAALRVLIHGLHETR